MELLGQLESAERALVDSQSAANCVLRDNEGLREQLITALHSFKTAQASTAASDQEVDRLRSQVRGQGLSGMGGGGGYAGFIVRCWSGLI